MLWTHRCSSVYHESRTLASLSFFSPQGFSQVTLIGSKPPHPRRITTEWPHGPFGPSFSWMRRGRGPFGHGPFGPGEPHRFFGRGDLKFALLELLQERPMHGYEMMKALEEKSGGFYAPSPGSIYPTLQMLEDRGFVTSNNVEGKKIYTITDSGRTMLAERQKNDEEFTGPPWMRR